MKILVTGGCSFSRPGMLEHDYTWSNYLEQTNKFDLAIHTGLSAIGNDLISRKIIYNVNELLKNHASDKLTVGIMWSGPNRHSAYLLEKPENFNKEFTNQENPTSVCPGENNWYVLLSPKAPGVFQVDSHSLMHYKYFYNLTASYINSCEHILRTQWFLEKNKVRYFMTTYTGNVLPKSLKENKEVSHLIDLINFENFLPIEGELEWCKKNTNLPFFKPNDFHPSCLQHKLFTEEVVIPFLREGQYI